MLASLNGIIPPKDDGQGTVAGAPLPQRPASRTAPAVNPIPEQHQAGRGRKKFTAVGAYWLWPRPQQPEMVAAPTQKHPLLEKIVAGNTALARADSAKRKLEVLGGIGSAQDSAKAAQRRARQGRLAPRESRQQG